VAAITHTPVVAGQGAKKVFVSNGYLRIRSCVYYHPVEFVDSAGELVNCAKLSLKAAVSPSLKLPKKITLIYKQKNGVNLFVNLSIST